MFNRLFSLIFDLLESSSSKRRYSIYRKKYNLPSSFLFGANGSVIYGDGNFEAGDNSYVNQVWIQISDGNKVKLGRNCRLAHNIRIYTSSVIADQNLDIDPWGNENMEKRGDVIIGDGVWIGANVFINPGITIGSNAVIGANSVVTKDIQPLSIVGGVPAKHIRFKTISQ